MGRKAKKKSTKKLSKESWSIVKASRKGALDDICIKMHTAMCSNNNRLPYGYVTKLLDDLKDAPSFQWLTRNIINKAFLSFKAKLEEQKKNQDQKEKIVGMDLDVETLRSNSADLSELSGDVPSKLTSESDASKRSKGGRPIGTTIKAKEDRVRKSFQMKNEIAERFSAVKQKSKKNRKVKSGTLKGIIEDVKNKYKLHDIKISPSAIRQRLYRKKPICHHVAGRISPLESIEPTVISIVIQMARIRQSLSPSEGLRLINSLIKDTKIEDDLVYWKKKFSNNTSPTVGLGCWSRFMKRHKDKIVSKRGQRYELNRQKWTTYSNFVHMYNHCINKMVNAGVAVELDTPVWMDRAGNECDEANSYGCMVTHKLIRPEMCICGDEVGGNLSMKGDGNEAGKLLLGERGCVAQEKASARNRKFTLIGFTALTGDPVMCVIIFEGKTPNGSIEAGIDISVKPNGCPTDPNFVEINSGPGKYFPGAPMCEYKGKKVPAVIRWHESASITSEILTEVFQTMDHHQLFERTADVKPFVLIDGHKSRLEIPFLRYINTPKDNWIVCIGVPYGTALWQVGDSKEQNGSFNINMTKAKTKMLETRDKLGLNELEDTDLIPIINYAWNHSFARKDKNRNAIADRGWNPLNRKLLTDEDLSATMTDKEKTRKYNEMNNIIHPSKSYEADSICNATSTSSSAPTCSTFTMNSQPTINNPPQPPSLNFSYGTARNCLDALVKDSDLQKARERIKENLNKGITIKHQLKEAKRITSGIVFKCNTTRLGQTVFDACNENRIKKKQQERDKIRKEKESHAIMVQKAMEVLQQKPDINKMTIRDLTTICKPLKLKSDGKMPNKKQELIEAYLVWKNRPPPDFEDDFSTDEEVEAVARPVEDTITGTATGNSDEEISAHPQIMNENIMLVADV